MIFTTESASKPTYAATADFPSQVEDVSGALGRGGYEGVQNDSAGNLWIVEDIGGSNKPAPFKRPENGQFRPGSEFTQFLFDVNVDYSNPGNTRLRWLAEGRDASAAIDGSTPGAFGRTTVTTRSPARTSRTAIRVRRGSSA